MGWARGVRVARWMFLAYAVALFTATHWPALKIEGAGRPDIWIHGAVFALWTALILNARFFGEPLSRRNIVLAAIFAIVYAAVDEGLQAIPWVRRHAAFDDFFADVSGVLIVIAGACVLARRRRAAQPPLRSPPQ